MCEVDNTCSPKGLGDIVWQIVLGEHDMVMLEEEESFYEDFGADFHYNDPQVECFLAKDIV